MRWTGALTLAAVLFGGCGGMPLLPRPAPVGALEPGATPPAGTRVRFDEPVLDDDRTTLTLPFTGGRPYDAADPCSTAYVGWAAPSKTDANVLEALVIDVTPPVPLQPEGVACDAVGHARRVQVRLGEPFSGTAITDVGGGEGMTWFLGGAPPGLATVPDLPPGWTLVDEGNLEGEVHGRWQRTWAAPGLDANDVGSPGRIEVIQAFDGAAMVTGGEEVRDVLVNDAPATLYRQAPPGELVLVWQLGADGMAVIANEADFPAARLIELAEAIRPAP